MLDFSAEKDRLFDPNSPVPHKSPDSGPDPMIARGNTKNPNTPIPPLKRKGPRQPIGDLPVWNSFIV